MLAWHCPAVLLCVQLSSSLLSSYYSIQTTIITLNLTFSEFVSFSTMWVSLTLGTSKNKAKGKKQNGPFLGSGHSGVSGQWSQVFITDAYAMRESFRYNILPAVPGIDDCSTLPSFDVYGQIMSKLCVIVMLFGNFNVLKGECCRMRGCYVWPGLFPRTVVVPRP